MDFKPSKVKKLLITADFRLGKEIYATDTSKLVLSLYKEGKSISDIMEITGLRRSAVFGYLPYTKTVYKAEELSTDAERIRLFRDRQQRCREYAATTSLMTAVEKEDYLWDTLLFLQGCIFRTSGRGGKPGQKFRCKIRSR